MHWPQKQDNNLLLKQHTMFWDILQHNRKNVKKTKKILQLHFFEKNWTLGHRKENIVEKKIELYNFSTLFVFVEGTASNKVN